jgi:hypothetical protein
MSASGNAFQKQSHTRAACTADLIFVGRLPSQKLATEPSVAYEQAPEPKKAAKGTPKKVQKAMQSQDNGPGERGGRDQAAVTLSTNAPATGTVVKMGRREGWARFLAYEVRNFYKYPVPGHRPTPLCMIESVPRMTMRC